MIQKQNITISYRENSMFNTKFKTSSIEEKLQHKHRGQSLVEFALILGLIVVLMIISFDVFNLLQQKADLDKMILQAARQAGEFGGSGATGDGSSEVVDYIEAQMTSMSYDAATISAAVSTLVLDTKTFTGGPISDPDLVSGTAIDECNYGEFITVTMQVPWNTNIPIALFFNGFNGAGTFVISGTARCWRA
ncbi:MAG: TadE/TadG family type IV pilus assembly protein [Chloroflexota bacterium]